MIARSWTGKTLEENAARYLELMTTVALEDYRSVPGNLGVHVLHRADGDLHQFTMLTFWESEEAVRRFAGDDVEAAVFYDFDSEFLVEADKRALHFEVVSP